MARNKCVNLRCLCIIQHHRYVTWLAHREIDKVQTKLRCGDPILFVPSLIKRVSRLRDNSDLRCTRDHFME